MSRAKKIWLTAAAVLTVAGLVIFAGVMANYKMDFSKFTTEKKTTKTQEITDNFDKISIDVDTTDIEFVLSQDEKCKIVCTETEKLKHSAKVQNGTLIIKMTDNRQWYDHIGIFTGGYKITVYLPQQNYASVLIDTDTGDIMLGSVTVGEIDLATNTGDMYINRVTTTGNINAETDTGDMTFKNTIALAALNIETDTGDVNFESFDANKLFIETNTGDVTFEKSDSRELFIETDTGDVRGNLLSDKVFIVSSDTGRIRVPESTSGGKCKITTDTGDVQIEIKP